MDMPAARLQQRFIRNIAYQSMFERIPRGGPALDDANDLVPLEGLDCRIQFCLSYGSDSKQQGVRKVPPDRRPDLRHLLGGAKPAEPTPRRHMPARVARRVSE